MSIIVFVSFIVIITWLISNYDSYLPNILKILKSKKQDHINR